MNTKKKIRVLIVDDSSIIRTLLSKLLSTDPEIEIVGTAPDPYVAREKLIQLRPDVMTLDIEMPRMDGVTFLSKVMHHFPIRTVIISSLSTAGSEMALKALENGAIDVVAKPAIDVTRSLEELGAEIIMKVKSAAHSTIPQLCDRLPRVVSGTSGKSESLARTTHQILAIASSTGGTEALKRVLPCMPSDIPGTVIVQHMPPVFTKSYAQHLQSLCPFEVKEAEDGDKVMPGRVLLAPGNFHMELRREGGYYRVALQQEAAIHGVRPAADILLSTVAKHAGKNSIGVVLTGMGKDGAKGLLEMKQAGGFTIAQDEATCVVYGMPKTAVELGAIDRIMPLDKIAETILQRLKSKDAA